MVKKSNKNSQKENKRSIKTTNNESKRSIKTTNNESKKFLSFKIKYFLILSLILLIGVIFYLAYVNLVLFPGDSIETNSSNFLSECTVDEDCVKVQTTCCSCSMGGNEVCVPKDKAEEYRMNESECPKNNICVAMYNCNKNTCICEEGNCGFPNSSE